MDSQEELQKNRNAESASVRKQLWGSEESEDSGEDMRQTVLGDINNITNPQPTPPQQNAPSKLPLLATALLGAAIPTAGFVGYLASQPSTPAPTPTINTPGFDDETVSIGLGRIEDYTK